MYLPSLCPVDFPLWQRVVDDLCQTRAATQRIPSPLPSAPAAHQVAGQSSSVAADPKITRHWFATLAGNYDMSFFLLF